MPNHIRCILLIARFSILFLTNLVRLHITYVQRLHIFSNKLFSVMKGSPYVLEIQHVSGSEYEIEWQFCKQELEFKSLKEQMYDGGSNSFGKQPPQAVYLTLLSVQTSMPQTITVPDCYNYKPLQIVHLCAHVKTLPLLALLFAQHANTNKKNATSNKLTLHELCVNSTIRIYPYFSYIRLYF